VLVMIYLTNAGYLHAGKGAPSLKLECQVYRH
jgi:hypothetical protein